MATQGNRWLAPFAFFAALFLAPPAPLSAGDCEQAREPYERSAYRHWIDADGDCEDTRAEVLIRSGFTSGECRITEIQFFDPYTGTKYSGSATRVHVDHLVPLAEAHRSGGWGWGEEEREAFANDMENLFATKASVNLSKGDKDPAGWLPPAEERHCWYVHAWLRVKEEYELAMDGAEVAAVGRALRRCHGLYFSAPGRYHIGVSEGDNGENQ